jgi:exonuclease SbcC
MIPIKLELKNFMAYREPDPLDFSGLHTVCLTGDNGAGKSSLLDAMTWAVWGEARAKRDDELINQGAGDMRVALTFSEGTQIYQVVRTRKVGKAAKGKAPASTGMLEFFIKNSDNGWTQLTEPRTNETQDKIVRTLNLTYDTFINSAYLKQGRADEFTLKPPAQRKELLSEILSLDIWQDYEARAKDKLAHVMDERQKRQQELDKHNEEMSKLPAYQQQLEVAQAAQATAQDTMMQAEAAMTEIERLRERGRALRAQAAQVDQRLRGIQTELDQLNAERAGHTALMQQYQSAIDQRAEIERGFVALEQGRAENEALNLKLSSMTELNARKFAAETALADARRRIESDLDDKKRRLRDLQTLAADQNLVQRLSEVSAQIEAIETAQSERELKQVELSQTFEQQSEARAQNDVLKREMNDLKTRMNALNKVGAICPTCHRPLGEEERTRLLAEWENSGKERGAAYRANEALVKQLADKRAGVEQSMTALDARTRGLNALQREQIALSERLTRAQAAAEQLPEAEQAVSLAQGVLDGANYAPEAQTALSKVNAELVEVGYDAAAHSQLRTRLEQLKIFAERKAQLDRAAVQVESENRALQTLLLQEQTLKDRRALEEKAGADVRTQLAEVEVQLRREPEVTAAQNQSRDAFYTAQRMAIAANQKVQACMALEGTVRRLRDEIDDFSLQQSQLEELRTAFGRNGVPAMIIENVLPELEFTANQLLARMTNGRMNVRFETQRLTQKGDTAETLEIRIADEVGERSYEMYSGGEAFRVNFAIRIALSKLLARRANAKLQTLFVDEGFGTQDAQGLEALIEAIQSISDDFERIFVITHIEALKDAFPARIEVVKTPAGSKARIV